MSTPTSYFQTQANGPGFIKGIAADIADFWHSLTDPVQNAAGKFRRKRADYYETLADRLENASGLTLKDLFERDAARYSADREGNPIKTPEGVLAAHWAARYVEVGGNLAMTFEGTLPPEDVALIRVGEQAGAGALPSTLRDMARLTGMVARAKSTFLATTLVGFATLCVLVAALFSMPLYTVPMLRETFSALPLDQLPPRAQTMFGFSDAISANALVLVIFAAAAGWWVKWSLTNLVGPWRTKLDQVLIWRLYRDFQGAMFLAILSTIVKRRNNSSTQLPDGLAQLREGASPWMQWHIDQMSSNLSQVNSSQAEENSTAIANALNTGLIDQETFWYFLDVQDGAGIAVGLQKTGLRVEGPTLKKVARRAAWLRAAMIVFALLGVFGVGAMTASAGSALLQATKLFYQS
jgi:hypothetical protein